MDPEAAEADALLTLGDEIATLAAHIHAATHRLLVLVAEFDRRRGWERAGFRSCAHWLAYRTGIDLGACRERVRAARALEALPAVGEAMARGELSFSKVRALTRIATPDNEVELIEYARAGTAAELERLVRGWKLLGTTDEAERERIRHGRRTLSVFPGDDGMYVVRGRLEPEMGALLMRAIEAASDALYRRDGSSPAGALGRGGDPSTHAEAARRRADALALLAERAMASGFGDDDVGSPHAAPVSGTRAERYQVVLHVDAGTLRGDGEAGRSELEDGTRVSAETSRRLACDASVVRMRESRGEILDVGRRTRTVPPALRRALDARDRGCRFPGCGLRFTDAHHLRHWAEGGPTRLDNLVLLCGFHHRLVHEGGWRIELGPTGRVNIYDPRGLPLPGAPPAPGIAVDRLLAVHRGRGVRPDYRTASARWKYDRDIPARVTARVLDATRPIDPAPDRSDGRTPGERRAHPG